MHETLDRRGTITVPCLHCGEPMVTMRHLVICAGENPDKRWELLKCSKCASGGRGRRDGGYSECPCENCRRINGPSSGGLTPRQNAKRGMTDS